MIIRVFTGLNSKRLTFLFLPFIQWYIAVTSILHIIVYYIVYVQLCSASCMSTWKEEKRGSPKNFILFSLFTYIWGTHHFKTCITKTQCTNSTFVVNRLVRCTCLSRIYTREYCYTHDIVYVYKTIVFATKWFSTLFFVGNIYSFFFFFAQINSGCIKKRNCCRSSPSILKKTFLPPESSEMDLRLK